MLGSEGGRCKLTCQSWLYQFGGKISSIKIGNKPDIIGVGVEMYYLGNHKNIYLKVFEYSLHGII